MGMTLPVAESVFFWANWALVLALGLGVIATYLIVVSGNAKEAFTKVEASKAATRETQANERIAQLGKDAAHLSADAQASKAEIAKANARALEAQLALERFKALRAIAIAAMADLMRVLKPFAGQKTAIFAVEGVEPTNLAGDVSHALTLAGWNAPTWRWSANIAATGVLISAKSGAASEEGKAAAALADALLSAGVGARVILWPGEWKDFGMLNGPPFDVGIPIRVIVGAKPP